MNVRVHPPQINSSRRLAHWFLSTVGAPILYGCLALATCYATASEEGELSPLQLKGQGIYRESCADCHGAGGQGVEGAYESPLTGDDSVGQLQQIIADTMPEGEPEVCVGEDAEAVAAYMHYSFYSEAAQIRNRPPRVTLARLTADQLRQSLADLYSSFDRVPNVTAERGVKGLYFAGSRWKDEEKKIERVDPTLNFDFRRESPGEGIEAEEFYIHWSGGLLADVSGRYEIVVRSTCSFVMKFGSNDRQLIDNHVQSGDKTEFRETLSLTAGRVYPFTIEFKQKKRKTEQPPANISLSWVRPHGIEEIVPERNLVPHNVPASFALQAVLPPDDRSYGFERGVAINRQWDESTTAAAIEFSAIARDELWPQYERRHRKEPNENRARLRGFLTELVRTAFRGNLSPELQALYVDRQVDAEPDDGEAIKRVMLLALKSPRFLYPALDADSNPSQRAANRLALILYDSLPSSPELAKQVEKGEFTSTDAIRSFVQRHVDDYRVRAKTREFLYEWLNLGHLQDISKAEEHYPNFSPELVADLRASLDAFLDQVVWGDSGDFRKLFVADWSYTTPRIAEYYGSGWQPAENFETENSAEAAGYIPAPGLKRTANDAEQHRGILTHPLLLSGLAYYDSTSPIHRGVFLIRYVLGRTLRPPNEAFTPLSPDLHPDLTTRERVSLQTSPESCQVCHSRINGLGFALENYDAVGKYREMERGKSIDSQGRYTTRSGEQVTFKGIKELSDFLVTSEDAQVGFVRKAFQHFVKQPPAAFGNDTLERLVDGFRESQFNVRDLIVEIAVVAAEYAARQPTAERLAER